VLTRQEACARFADASPRLIPGIGPKTVARLEELGLTTLAAVARAPEELLAQRFGPNHGRDLRRRARFESDGLVSQARKVVSESRERTFDYDLRQFSQLREALLAMTRSLCESLATHERRGRTIGIKVRLDDWTTITRARSIPRATNDYDTVAAVALRLLEENAPERPVRLLGVRVAGLAAPGESQREASQGSAQAARAAAAGADAGHAGAPQMALPM
jgi:DNA polymerase-4